MFRNAAIATLALLGSAGLASAATVERPLAMSANATANCQGALPNFEGNIRKRPLALQNEGGATAFVTCSFVNQFEDVQGETRAISYFGAFFSNRTGGEITVTCTGVAGFDGGPDNVSLGKTVVLPPNSASLAQIMFTPADNGGFGFYPIASMSCAIPPGAGIADTYVGYIFADDIGDN